MSLIIFSFVILVSAVIVCLFAVPMGIMAGLCLASALGAGKAVFVLGSFVPFLLIVISLWTTILMKRLSYC